MLMASNNGREKSLESWIWDAACSIRGAKDAPKYKDYILPLIFTKRLCDVFDDELNRIATEVGSRRKAFQLAKADHKLVRFYLPLVPQDPEQPVWSVIRKLADRIGEGVTSHMRAIARENPLLQGIIDRVVANPMWNQDWFTEADYDNDELDRFPAGAGFPGKSSADWGWVQHMHASLNATGRAAIVLDTGAASRGSGNAGTNKEKTVRQWFVDQDFVESVLYFFPTLWSKRC